MPGGTLASLTGVLALILSSHVALAKPRIYGPETEIVIQAAVSLKEGQKRQVSTWGRNAAYFGAIAVNVIEDVSTWTRGYHSAKAAQEIALSMCRAKARKAPDGCIILASQTPSGVSPQSRTASGLSWNASKAFERDFLGTVKPGKYSAFAAAELGFWGIIWGQSSAAVASQKARALCAKSVERHLAGLRPEVQRVARARGYNRCKIIEVVKGP